MSVDLLRIEPTRNIRRFYRVVVVPSLFGEWTVMREWGRIGQPGTVRARTFASEPKAHAVADMLLRAKQRRGYREGPWTDAMEERPQRGPTRAEANA